MTTFAVAAPPPIASSPRPTTAPTRNTTTQPSATSPDTVRNAPNAFMAKLDALARVTLDGPRVAWAIQEGQSAPDIASRYGIRQGSDAFKMLESRVEARRLAAIGDGLGV